MNGKERVDAVMKGTQPDRVPVMCQLSTGHLVKHSGLSPAEFLINYNAAYPDTLVRLTKKYNFDGVLLDYPGHPYAGGINTEAAISQIESITKEGSGELITWKNGDSVYCPPNDYPMARTKHINERKDITELSFKDLPFHDGYRLKLNELPDHFLEAYRSTLRQIGSTHSVHAFVASPLSGLMVCYGIEDTLLGMIDYPEVVKKILEEMIEGCLIWIDNIIDTGVHAVCVTAPYEGSGLISLDMYREFGLPFAAKLVEHISKRGVPSYMHMCGSISDRLEAVADTGVNGLECLDPKPMGNVDLEDAVKRLGSRIFIKGNIDPVNTLYMKSKDEVYKDAVHRIKTGKPTKRFILSSACSVSPDTPQENLMILNEIAEEYGQY